MKLLNTLVITWLVGMMPLQAAPQDEINSLLDYLEGLQGAVFVRNGKEHNSQETRKHLQMKWDRQEKKIHSAEDFIKLCASKSYLSGKRYVIRLKDGSEKFSDELLKAELKRIRSQAK
ncbi:MAG: DUF5329 domain-containing protein [Verrucomicrobiales bacterium]|nr:DUF5329 domain-containing protein [Verrucomicrobiales bacterium]